MTTDDSPKRRASNSSEWQAKRDDLAHKLRLTPLLPKSYPSSSYYETLDFFTDALGECINVSKVCGELRAPTTRHFWASVLYVEMIKRAVSLGMLAPHSAWSEQLIESWDYASVVNITRTLMEVRFAYFYIAVQECPEDEWQCRWDLFALHDNCARTYLVNQRDPEATEVLANKAEIGDEIRRRLMNNPHFQTYTVKQRRSFLKGESAYLKSLEDIATEAGMERSLYRWLNKIFSSHVHSYPLSFMRLAENRDSHRPTQTEESSISLCLSIAATMIIRSRDEMKFMFKDIIPAFAEAKKPSSEPIGRQFRESREQS